MRCAAPSQITEERPAFVLFEEFVVTAIGFSILIVAFGITYGRSCPFDFAKIASFSYASSTSPRPAIKACSASRALLSCETMWS